MVVVGFCFFYGLVGFNGVYTFLFRGACVSVYVCVWWTCLTGSGNDHNHVYQNNFFSALLDLMECTYFCSIYIWLESIRGHSACPVMSSSSVCWVEQRFHEIILSSQSSQIGRPFCVDLASVSFEPEAHSVLQPLGETITVSSPRYAVFEWQRACAGIRLYANGRILYARHMHSLRDGLENDAF